MRVNEEEKPDRGRLPWDSSVGTYVVVVEDGGWMEFSTGLSWLTELAPSCSSVQRRTRPTTERKLPYS